MKDAIVDMRVISNRHQPFGRVTIWKPCQSQETA